MLNDIGPFLSWRRRQRRAQALARHYVFRTPHDIFHGSGAASKNDGPITCLNTAAPRRRLFVYRAADDGGAR